MTTARGLYEFSLRKRMRELKKDLENKNTPSVVILGVEATTLGDEAINAINAFAEDGNPALLNHKLEVIEQLLNADEDNPQD